MPAQTSINKTDQTEVANVATRACATLHLIEAGEIIGLVEPPAIERNEANSEWIVRTGKANLRAKHHVREVALTEQAIHKWRIRKVGRRDRERQRHGDGKIQSSRGKRGRRQHYARQDAARVRQLEEHAHRAEADQDVGDGRVADHVQ